MVVGRLAPIVPPSLPAEAPWPAQIVPAMFDYLGLLCGLQLLVAIFVLVAAIQFLRLRAWARTALEVVTWLQLIYTVGFGLLWVGAWASIASNLPAGGDLPISAGALTAVGVAMGVGIALVFAVPCAVIIWVLRGEPVRRAMIM